MVISLTCMALDTRLQGADWRQLDVGHTKKVLQLLVAPGIPPLFSTDIHLDHFSGLILVRYDVQRLCHPIFQQDHKKRKEFCYLGQDKRLGWSVG